MKYSEVGNATLMFRPEPREHHSRYPDKGSRCLSPTDKPPNTFHSIHSNPAPLFGRSRRTLRDVRTWQYRLVDLYTASEVQQIDDPANERQDARPKRPRPMVHSKRWQICLIMQQGSSHNFDEWPKCSVVLPTALLTPKLAIHHCMYPYILWTELSLLHLLNVFPIK